MLDASAVTFGESGTGKTLTSPNASTLLVNAAGTTTFHGAVGGTPGGGNELGSLTTDALGTTAINGGSVTTTAEQAYKDNVTLGANTVLDASAVTFGESGTGKTLTSPNASTLLVNAAGTTTFHGAVGGTPGGGNELGSLTTDAPGTTAINGGSVTTTAEQAYKDNVTLGANTVLDASAVTFGESGTGKTLTSPNASTLLVNAAGTTTFHGAVGGTPGGGNELGSLTTDALGTTAINGGSVTTTAEQAYKDNVTLGANTVLDASAVTFGESGTGKTLTSPNASTLLVNAAGTTTFHGAVGGTPGGGNELGSLTTDALGTTAINGGSVTTTAEQAYKDNVTLGANTVLDASAVTFGESGTGKTLTSPNASTLLVNAAGTTTFHGAVGGTPGGGNELGSLTTDAPGTTAINGGSVTTTAEQAYKDNVTLGANTVLDASAVTFGESGTGKTLTSPNASTLLVNAAGTTTFHGAVGGTPGGGNELGSLTTDALGTTAINGGSVTTTAEQAYKDNVTLGANTVLDASAVTFGESGTGKTLTSPNASTLLVNAAGTTTFHGAVGGTPGGGNELGSLTTDALGTTAINGGSVTTTGDQTYLDPVAIGANTALSAGGDVQLGGDVSGPGYALTVQAGDDVVIGGNIGSDSERLSQVKLNSGSEGDIVFNGDGAQGVYADNLIQLNTNRVAPPQDATIYKILGGQAPPGPETDVTLPLLELDAGPTGKFEMAANDKLSVPNGKLLIMAQNADVADLNALVVQVGSAAEPVDLITVLNRDLGPVELPDGTTVSDSGRDVNGNQVLWYFNDLNNQATFFTIGTPTGGEVSANIADSRTTDRVLLRAIFADVSSLEPADFFNESNVLDIVPLGPGDIANLDFIPYVPQDEEKNPGAVSNRAAVSQIPLRADELLAWFDCVEAEKGFECEEEIVGAERATSADADKIRALAADLFGETQEQRDRRFLEEAVDAYRAGTGARRVDGAEFRRFVETSPQHKEALRVLDRYGEMLAGIREFGVTDEAYDALKSTKLQQIAPASLGVDALGDAVEAGMTAWPRDPGVRVVAASDRMYLFRGRDTGRAYLFEEVPPTADVAPAP